MQILDIFNGFSTMIKRYWFVGEGHLYKIGIQYCIYLTVFKYSFNLFIFWYWRHFSSIKRWNGDYNTVLHGKQYGSLEFPEKYASCFAVFPALMCFSNSLPLGHWDLQVFLIKYLPIEDIVLLTMLQSGT